LAFLGQLRANKGQLECIDTYVDINETLLESNLFKWDIAKKNFGVKDSNT